MAANQTMAGRKFYKVMVTPVGLVCYLIRLMPTQDRLSHLLPCFIVVDMDHFISHPVLCLPRALIARTINQTHHERSHSQFTRETQLNIFYLVVSKDRFQ
jgi:hypothetical protein